MKIIQSVPGKKAAINEEERILDLKWLSQKAEFSHKSGVSQ